MPEEPHFSIALGSVLAGALSVKQAAFDEGRTVELPAPTEGLMAIHPASGIISMQFFGSRDGGVQTARSANVPYDLLLMTRGANQPWHGEIDHRPFQTEPHSCPLISCIPHGREAWVRYVAEANAASLLLFPPGRLSAMMPDADMQLNPVLMSDDEDLAALFSLIERDIIQPSSPMVGHIEILTRSLAHRLAALQQADSPNRSEDTLSISPGKLSRVLHFIDDHLDRPIRLTDIADVAGLSEYHFIRVFKHATGKTPYRHLQYRRVALSQTMIISTDKPIGQIATACGFATPQRFSASFAQEIGMSPSQYRKLGAKTSGDATGNGRIRL